MARILVVEDSEFTRRMIVQIIKAKGHEVLEAGNGFEGMRMVQKEKPDCIFLDLLMPEMDGFGVLGALKEKSLSIPIIILSADVQETSRNKCFEFGVVDFVKKPPKEDEILKAVRKALNSTVGTTV
ncbi:PleD family two-component system response regulator [Planctomycetota bacterium]